MSEVKDNSILKWVEASTLLGGTLVAAIATCAITLYRIDSLEDKVDKLVDSYQNVSILETKMNALRDSHLETQKIFDKFSDSVDRLSITVAKLEGKVEGLESNKKVNINGKEE